MFPRGISDQVATPAVGQFVCDDIDIFAVLEMLSTPIPCREHVLTYFGDDTGSREGEDRVFHPTIRETWRQNQDVVLPPDVGINDFLDLN